MGFVALDAWTHEQDIRAASGAGALHDDALLPGLVALTVGAMDRFYLGQGGPPLRLVVDGEEHRAGDGEPTATLTATSYDLMRMVFGRRSQAQIEAADWSARMPRQRGQRSPSSLRSRRTSATDRAPHHLAMTSSANRLMPSSLPARSASAPA